MTLNRIISDLGSYAVERGLAEESDRVYLHNCLLHAFGGDSFADDQGPEPIAEVLAAADGYAAAHNLAELETLSERDCYEAYLMGLLMPRPSEVISRFWSEYGKSPQAATDYFYRLSTDSRYIRTDRLARNIVYRASGRRCSLLITINLSKPEKDPKEIARLREVRSSTYPLCLLCRENEGFYGSLTWPGRSNHRLIPLKLDGDDFFFQYSPYGYFSEHCIVLKKEHEPMRIDRRTFARLFSFLDIFPHYIIGSNADLPIVGGSILSHEHYQGGRFVFPLAEAGNLVDGLTFAGFPHVSGSIVDWPMSVIRLDGPSKDELIGLSTHILGKWRSYSDEEVGLIADDGVGHNTVTPIARMRGRAYEIDLVLRNNRTDAANPLGIFHPHAELHHIKKENIGLIEVMGVAILPGRLKSELALCAAYLLNPSGPVDPALDKHLPWLRSLQEKYGSFARESVDGVIKKEVALVFERCLEDCGIFKRGPQGLNRFMRFVGSL